MGFRLVERLNVGATAGLLVAVAGYFWVNRLLPAELAERSLWEIRGFFSIWALCLLQPFIGPVARAWIAQLGLAALLMLGLPILNALTTDTHLAWSLLQRRWVLVGFELTVLACGAACAYAAWYLATRGTRAAARRRTSVVDRRARPVLVEQA